MASDVAILRWTGCTGDEYFSFVCPTCGWTSATLFAAADCFELHCEQCEARAQGMRRREDLLKNCGAQYLTPAELDDVARIASAAGVIRHTKRMGRTGSTAPHDVNGS